MKWEEIVKIQYDAIQKSSLVYVTILSAFVGFSEKLSLGFCSKVFLIITFAFVLFQNFYVLILINIQRKISYNPNLDLKQNEKENIARERVLWLSGLVSLFLLLTILSIVFNFK